MAEVKKEPAALAVINDLPAAGGLVPRNWPEMQAMAETLAKSTMIPESLRGKPADVFAVLQLGMELNLKPMQSLLQIYVVKGRPGCSAALKRALVVTSPLCEYAHFTESTDKKATFVTKRRGSSHKETSTTFTIEMANAAGLTLNPSYKAHPAAMLRARASSAQLDAEWSDVVQGMSTLDELREIEGDVVDVKPNRPTLVSVSAPESKAAPVSSVPDEPVDDEFERSVREQNKPADDEAPPVEKAETKQPNSSEPTEAEKMLIYIDEAQEVSQLNKLTDRIVKWVDKNEGQKIRDHFNQRAKDLRKAGK